MSASIVESKPTERLHGSAQFETRTHVLRLVAFGIFLVPVWMFFHPYAGITHDSTLYTLCALARLTPALANDVFLKYGSQDHFTLFGPLYAGAIKYFGLEPAAAALTFISQIAFFVAAYHLARRWTTASWSLLSVGVLMVMPSDYGTFNIFKGIEGFLTPRLPTEALTLAALTCCLAGKKAWAAVFFVGAVTLHPIMASAGAAMCFALYVAMPRPKLAAAISASGLLAFIGVALLMPIGPIGQFDDQWLQLVQDRSPFSFAHLWSFDHWVRVLLPLGTLTLIACFSQNDVAKRISRGALLTACGGVGLTILCSDLLHIVLVTQIQPWRWLWLANTCAILLLPLFANECWKSGNLMRACLLLCALAWMLRQDSALSAEALAAAFFVFAIKNRLPQPRHQSWVFYGVCVAFLVVLTLNALENFSSSLAFDNDLVNPSFPRMHFWASNVVWPLAMIMLAWWATQRSRIAVLPAMVLLFIVAIAALMPATWQSWSQQIYQPTYPAYADFRRIIPPGKDVLWAESPLKTWYLLERPNYLSLNQTAGIVFSRETAIEVERRAVQSAPLLPEYAFSVWASKAALDVETPRKLAAACAAGDLEYVVSMVDLSVPALATMMINPKLPRVKVRLYSCSSIRH
jgi:hypothetical protein